MGKHGSKKAKGRTAGKKAAPRAEGKKSKRARKRGLGPAFFIFVMLMLAGTGVFILSQHQFAVTNELKIDRIEQKIVAQKAKQRSLRMKLARLKSPSRIVRIAQDELGMVDPGGIIYIKYGRDSSGNLVCQSSYEKRFERLRMVPEPKEEKEPEETPGTISQR